MSRSPSGLRARLVQRALGVVREVPPLRRFVSRRIINRYAYAAPPRPRPLSMAAGYVTWRGLTDRRYSGRHLPPEDAPKHPPLDAVVELFRRTEDRRATDTSLLFPFFAQWFTDSFLRTKWKPAETQDFAENESNHEIDLCQIYGLTEAQTRMLRAHEGGRLKSQILNGEAWPVFLFEAKGGGAPRLKPEFERLHSPENFERVFGRVSDAEKRRAFAVGLEHGDATLGASVMNALWLREHNRVAGLLARAHPDWDDERLFQTARCVCVVELLNIVIGDYIVHIAPVPFPLQAVPGMAERERWYRTNWIAVEFALLYRWHDLIPATVTFGGETRDAEALRRNNQWAISLGLDRILLDASRQKAGRIALGNTAPFLLDVKRHSVEMARACRLASFNAYRRRYGLKPYDSFEALTDDRASADKLRALYGDVDDLEWFVGLFAERYGEREMMGELLTTMVAHDAFTQALTNPLLSEAVYGPETFSPEGLRIIESTETLADVIARNTGVGDPKAVGFVPRG